MSRLRTIARRSFLIGSAAVVGGTVFGVYKFRQPHPNPLLNELPEGASAITPYVRIDAQGVTIITPRAEMGQGIHTTLAALVAEELDVAWDSIRVEHGAPGAAYYNRALMQEGVPFASLDHSRMAEGMRGTMGVLAKFMGIQGTGGSSSVPDAFDKMRVAGAAARFALVAAAAERLGVHAATLKTADGAVIASDGKRLPYTELVLAAAKVQLPDNPPLKPRGTVLNAVFPASGGSRAASATRAYDVLLGCINQALPEGLAAADSGNAGVIVVAAPDPRTGRDRVNVINTIHGGGGARRSRDGVDGTAVRYSQRSVPVEIIEVETAMIMRAIRIVPDSRRAGRYVSGAALQMEIENTAHRAVMTVRNMNRFVFSAWGFRGGEHGVKGTAVLNPGRPDERSIGKISVLELNRGDVIQITSPTGGGFGDPMERDLAAIASEIRNGMLSPERASQVYAIVFDEHGQIDEVATAARRRERTKADTPEFTFCDERLRQDQVWPQDMRRQLAAMALTYDQRIRSQLVGTVHHRMMNDGHQVDTKIIRQMVDDEAENMTGVRR